MNVSPYPSDRPDGSVLWEIRRQDCGLQLVHTDGVSATGPGKVATEHLMTVFTMTDFVVQGRLLYRRNLADFQAVSLVPKGFSASERRDADARVLGEAILHACGC